MDGIPFVASSMASRFLEGLVVDVLDSWGREMLVVQHRDLKGC